MAGKQRSRITIQSPSTIQNELNEIGTSWVDVYRNIRAEKTKARGSESHNKSGELAQTVWQFRIRFFPGVTEMCRIVENDLVYDIVSFDNVKQKNRELLIECIQRSRHNTTGL